MKKTVISLTLASIFIFTGCEKQPALEQDTKKNENSSVNTNKNLSTNNKNDITEDFAAIQTFSTQKEQEAAGIAEKVQNAISSNDESEKAQAALEMSNKRAEINKEFATLPLKSTEVNAFREKSMKINQLAIDLSNESTSKAPDANKISEIMKSVQSLQSEIETDVKAIQAKVS